MCDLRVVIKLFFQIKKDGEVELMLRKAKEGSWAKYMGISGSGLETEDE